MKYFAIALALLSVTIAAATPADALGTNNGFCKNGKLQANHCK